MHELAIRTRTLIATALSQFTQSAEVADVIGLGIASGKNVLLYGPGGYGKSEMTKAILDTSFEPDVQIWKMQLHVESTISSLFGGMNMRELRDTGREVYNVQGGMSEAHIVVLEEMLDAPPAVLASLKTLFTERAILNGAQREPSDIRFAIALTNKAPEEIMSLGPSEEATMERFPLRLMVVWNKDTVEDRRALYDLVHDNAVALPRRLAQPLTLAELEQMAALVDAVSITASYKATKAQLVSRLKALKTISPRVDIQADAVAKASAWFAGRNKVTLEDLRVMRFFAVDDPTKSAEYDQIFFEVVEMKLREEKDREFMDGTKKVVEDLKAAMRHGFNTANDAATAAKEARTYAEMIVQQEVLEHNKDERQRLSDELRKAANELLLSLAN